MSRIRVNLDADLPLEITRQIDLVCDEFEAALQGDVSLGLDKYTDRVDPRGRSCLLEELTFLALERLRQTGASDPPGKLLAANPLLRDELARIIDEADGPATVSTDRRPRSTSKSGGLAIRCPHCHSMMELIVDASLMEIACSSCGGMFSLINDAANTRGAAAVTRLAHFELIERLGMGQFGTVWKARDTMLERTVALKIPRQEQLDSVSVEKFMREARAAAQLRHPNIVSTHEVGRHGDTLYIVIDYIRGVPLAVMTADHRLGIRESVSMVIKLADALEHAHQEGVIHRDIKPSNILVDDQGEPHLMDFGLAKRSENEITMTTEGAILGTPAYMSPEQARGEAHRVDGRSDIYSLGVILFQLLTGELPFRGSTRMLLQKVINDDPPGPRTLDSRVPRDLDTICLKCLEKEPSRRYPTARDLAADLRCYESGRPVTARRLGRLGRTLRWARRNWDVASLLAATMAILLTAAVVSTYFGWRAAESATRADQQAVTVTDTLYDSLLQEIRLTREVRQQGYGEKTRQLIDRARNLQTARVDIDELRRQLVLTMGDFVAYSPIVVAPAEGQINAIRLSNDGGELLTGLSIGRILIFDTKTGRMIASLENSDRDVLAVAISAGGNQLVIADTASKARVWRRMGQEWQIEREFQLAGTPRWVFFSRHGERVACVNKQLLDVWDVATGSKLQSLPIEADWSMLNGAFDKSCRRLVAGYVNARDDRVGWAMWDIDTGERLHEVDIPTLGGTYANGIDLAEVDDRMAIGFDQALLVYELNDFERTQLSGFDSIKAVAFNPTHPYLAALNIRGRISIWNSATNRQVATLQLAAPTMSRSCLSFSADGGRLAASNANSVQIWDLSRADEKTVLAGHTGGIPCAVFHPNGRLLATGGKDNVVRFWNPLTGQPTGSLDLGEAVQTLAFSADGRLLAAGSMGKDSAPHLRLIDVNSLKVAYEAGPAMDQVYSLSWTETVEGSFLAGCGPRGVALWKVHQGPPVTLEAVVELDRNWCLAAAIDRDVRVMVWAEEERKLKAWDVIAQQELPLHAPDMLQGWHGLNFLPDGRSIVYISNAGNAEIWDVETDQRGNSFGKPGMFSAPHIALSPNGKWLAALTQPDTVSIWHRPTGKYIFSMRPESGTVWSLAWDPSSEHLAVGQSDGGLGVWHLAKMRKKLAECGLPWQDDIND